MLDQGIYYRGLQILGGGSTLGGLILGATAVCIIDRQLVKAAGFTLAGAILTFFGLMHGSRSRDSQIASGLERLSAGLAAAGGVRKIRRARSIGHLRP